MEREEAIKICNELRKYLCEGNPAWKFNAVWNTEKVHEALTTAIIDMKMMPRMLERLGKVNAPAVTLDDISNAYENGYVQGKFEAAFDSESRVL